MSIRRFAALCGAAAAVTACALTTPAHATTPPRPSTPTVTERIAGDDRFTTAIQASKTAYPTTAPVVYLANGVNFPDALSAGPAAAHTDGPLLLTRPDTLRTDIKTEIQRLRPQKIILVGGTTSISTTIEKTLKPLTTTIQRIAGTDRFDTSRQLAKNTFTNPTTIYLATGRDFADALSAGAAAAKNNGPVLLIDGAATTLDTPTITLLKTLKPTTITITGGPAAITNSILTHTKTLAPTVNRIAGTDRFETSAAIARTWTNAPHAYLANGLNFPDALIGSAIAGKNHTPLLIIQPGCQPDAITDAQIALGTTEVHLIGGSAVLDTGAITRPCFNWPTPRP